MKKIYLLALLLCCLIYGAQSQDTTINQASIRNTQHHIPEIIVTAEKAETNLQVTPLSISVLSARDVHESRIWDIKDFSALIPNLYTGHPGDLRSVVGIRGIATSSYEPAVAVYVDGVNQFSLDSYISQLHNIEKIEVLRGPQGTLYGRNTSGGVINIITRQPENRIHGYTGIDYGSFGTQRYTAGIDVPLIADKLFVGGSGMFQVRDGLFTNAFNDSQYDDLKISQGNYFLKHQATPRLSFLLNLKHQKHLNDGAFPLAANIEQAFAEPYVLSQNRVSKMIDQTVNTSFSTTYHGERYAFSSQSSYQDNYRYYRDPIDGDFSEYDIIAVVNNYGKAWNRSKVAMHEMRLSSLSNTNAKLRWNVGLYGFIQRNPVKQGTYYGDDAGMYGVTITNVTDIHINRLDGHGFAGFGQLNYQLAPSLEILGGLRYDREYKRQQIGREFVPDGGEPITTRTDTAASDTYQNLSPKFAVRYTLSADNQIYGAYSRGFRAGGISELSPDPSEPPLVSYDSEYSDNLEIGSKNMFANRRLRVNATVFYTRIKDGQIPVLVMPEALTLMRNAARLESKGVELELYALPAKGLEFTYTFGYTDASYTDLSVADHGANKDLKGNKQIFTPKTTSYASVVYNRELSSIRDTRFFVRLENKTIGKVHFDLANTISQDPYNLISGRIGVQYKQTALSVWGSNLTNKTYIDYAYDFGAVHLAEPRMYGVTLKTSFAGKSIR